MPGSITTQSRCISSVKRWSDKVKLDYWNSIPGQRLRRWIVSVKKCIRHLRINNLWILELPPDVDWTHTSQEDEAIETSKQQWCCITCIEYIDCKWKRHFKDQINKQYDNHYWVSLVPQLNTYYLPSSQPFISSLVTHREATPAIHILM